MAGGWVQWDDGRSRKYRRLDSARPARPKRYFAGAPARSDKVVRMQPDIPYQPPAGAGSQAPKTRSFIPIDSATAASPAVEEPADVAALREVERYNVALRAAPHDTAKWLEHRRFAKLQEAERPAEWLSADFVARVARHAQAEMAPVCAVVGGVVASEVIKIISGKGAPINNAFFFDALDTSEGIVQRLGPSFSCPWGVDEGKATKLGEPNGAASKPKEVESLDLDD